MSGPKLVVEEHTVQQHTQSGVYNQHSYMSGPKPNVAGHGATKYAIRCIQSR